MVVRVRRSAAPCCALPCRACCSFLRCARARARGSQCSVYTAVRRRADGIQMHGKIISVSFDLDGSHYKQGKGLQVFVDGKLAKSSPMMAKLEVQL